MNDRKHFATKLNIEMWQIAMLFDNCGKSKRQHIIETIKEDPFSKDSDDNEEKVPITIGDLRNLWRELNDKQRMAIIKSIIWSSDNMYGFFKDVKKMLSSKFENTLD